MAKTPANSGSGRSVDEDDVAFGSENDAPARKKLRRPPPKTCKAKRRAPRRRKTE